MPAAKRNYTIEQGSVFNKQWIRKTSAGVVIPLTGYTAKLQARSDYSSSVKLIDATTENGKLVIDGVNGKVTFSLSATDTAALTAKAKLVWDIELYPAGVEANGFRWIEGNILVSPEVTR